MTDHSNDHQRRLIRALDRIDAALLSKTTPTSPQTTIDLRSLEMRVDRAIATVAALLDQKNGRNNG